MFRQIYLSPLGYLVSAILNIISWWPKPFMVYGHYNRKQKKFRKHTRISSSAVLNNASNIDIGDHVWVGHYCLLDGIGGIRIEEGVHIASHTCLYTHSSHDSIRLLGRTFIEVPAEKRPGYVIDKIQIGAYSFIGASSVILPGVTIGRGCVVGAGSVVNANVDDYTIVAGNPARPVGNTQERDIRLMDRFNCSSTYYLRQNGEG